MRYYIQSIVDRINNPLIRSSTKVPERLGKGNEEGELSLISMEKQ